ncbi:MAG: hypothetical protein M3144_09345 [Actinomycetota bacterium]|nr:hypothetical protein [Actinomycetota bacterium]
MDNPSSTAPTPGEVGGEPASPPGAPRWAKVFGIIAAVVVVLFLILLLTGGDHGPGRHGNGGQERPPAAEHTVRHP